MSLQAYELEILAYDPLVKKGKFVAFLAKE